MADKSVHNNIFWNKISVLVSGEITKLQLHLLLHFFHTIYKSETHNCKHNMSLVLLKG